MLPLRPECLFSPSAGHDPPRLSWSAVGAGAIDALIAPTPVATDAAASEVGEGDAAVDDVDDHVALTDTAAAACEQRMALIDAHKVSDTL